MLSDTLKSRMQYRIRKSKDSVFVLGDFLDLSQRDQIGRVLREFIKKKELIKIGYGLYAKARQSSVTGNTIPEKPLPALAAEALKKLNVEMAPSSLARRYNEGKTTQVPTGRVIAVKGRVSRKIGYDGKYISLEQAS